MARQDVRMCKRLIQLIAKLKGEFFRKGHQKEGHGMIKDDIMTKLEKQTINDLWATGPKLGHMLARLDLGWHTIDTEGAQGVALRHNWIYYGISTRQASIEYNFINARPLTYTTLPKSTRRALIFRGRLSCNSIIIELNRSYWPSMGHNRTHL